MEDQTKQRRERLIWVIVAIILFFVVANSMGIISTGHFERDNTQQMKQLADDYKEFWIEWDRTFGREKGN